MCAASCRLQNLVPLQATPVHTAGDRASAPKASLALNCVRFGSSRPMRTHGRWLSCGRPRQIGGATRLSNVSVRPASHPRGPTRESRTGGRKEAERERESEGRNGAPIVICRTSRLANAAGEHRAGRPSLITIPQCASAGVRTALPAVVVNVLSRYCTWRRPSLQARLTFITSRTHLPSISPPHRCCCWTAIPMSARV